MKRNRIVQMATITLMISLMMPCTLMASEYSNDIQIMSEVESDTVTEDVPEDVTEDVTEDNTEDVTDTETEIETELESEETETFEPEETENGDDVDQETEESTIESESSDTEDNNVDASEETEASDENTETETDQEDETELESDETLEELEEELGKLSEEEDQATDVTDEAESELSNPEYEEVSAWLRYYTSVPFEGLPDYITQEMIYNALYEQDQYNIPASVTIAQIIMDSGEGDSLTDLADEDDNLFKLTGTGSNGSSGEYASYHTFSDSMNARIELFQSRKMAAKIGRFDGLTGEDFNKAYTLKFGQVWYGDITKGYKLLRIIDQYDLNRIDEYTYDSFSEMMGTFANPCPGSHITSGFGYRAWSDSQHLGIDMATYGLHIPTYAAEAGTVISVGYGSSTGNMIVIDHGNGMVTKYMHHSQMYVKVGQKVLKGQQIGLSGTTGHSTGIHLHFQVEIDGTAVSPVSYLNNSGTDTSLVKEEKTTTVFATSSDSLKQVNKIGEAMGVDADNLFNEIPSSTSLGDDEYKKAALAQLNERIGKAVTQEIMGYISPQK